MRIALNALVGLILFAGGSSAATAQKVDPYPWCAEYGTGSADGGTNCYFMTYEQCMAALSGNGGFCRHNLFYSGAPDVRHATPRRR